MRNVDRIQSTLFIPTLDKIRYNENLRHETFAQEVTVNAKLCKNIAMKLQATYVVDICENRLREGILINIQNTMFYEEMKM